MDDPHFLCARLSQSRRKFKDRRAAPRHPIGCVNLAQGNAGPAELASVTERSKMAKATWGGKIIAESNACVVVEGNQYFPADAVKKEILKPSSHTTECSWKGTAHYYHVEVDGMRNDNAAWYYPQPKAAAAEIKDRIAFWKGVRVEV
jgi:uncharacterized protein (DUF427 family)